MATVQGRSGRKLLSHGRIVEVASRAIRRAGCHGVGVADIMKEAGLTHGAFYSHFDSRNAMVVAAMQCAARDSAERVAAEAATETAARGAGPFASFVNAYLHPTQVTQVERGCVVAALASEMPRQDKVVLDEARQRVNLLVSGVRNAMPEGASRLEAPLVTATMVGALQLARILGGKAGEALLAQTREELVKRYELGSSGKASFKAEALM